MLSFNGNKIITTSGGGALVSKNIELAQKSILATQARDDAPHYEHSELGFNYRMSNMCRYWKGANVSFRQSCS